MGRELGHQMHGKFYIGVVLFMLLLFLVTMLILSLYEKGGDSNGEPAEQTEAIPTVPSEASSGEFEEAAQEREGSRPQEKTLIETGGLRLVD